jgi:hypothetical protein
MPTLFLTKSPKTYNGEKTASSTNVVGESGYMPTKKLILDPCLSPCTSINSKWIKDLNIRPETMQLIHERAGNTMEAIDVGKDFHSRTISFPFPIPPVPILPLVCDPCPIILLHLFWVYNLHMRENI